MPLCGSCKSDARIQGREHDPYRADFYEADGLAFGEQCDRCGRSNDLRAFLKR